VLFVSILLLIVAAFFAAAGYFLLTRNDERDPWKKWRSREVGTALLTGTVFTLGLFALQIYLDQRAREEQFRVTVGVTRHLEGLEPEYSLEGMQLSHKSLDYAKLDNQNLRGANLQGASLRHADLRDADLQQADLLGADLTDAKLAGANFTEANLESATLRDAQIYAQGEEAPSIELTDTRVNARTCWPEDFLADPDAREARRALKQVETIVHGQTLADASLGHACVTTPDNIVEVEAPSPRGLSVNKAASTFRVTPKSVLDALVGNEEVDPRPDGPTIVTRLCARSREVGVRLGKWERVYSLLLVQPGDGQAAAARVLVLSGLRGALGTTVNLEQRLEPGTRVTLLGGEATQGRDWPTYRLDRRVRRC
jgi:hypothetical protein